MNVDQIAKLKTISQQLRKSVLRELLAAGSGHSAGCLGFADVMAVLYFMRHFYMPRGRSEDFSIKKSWLICENLTPSFKVIQNAAVYRELKRLAVLWVVV